MASADNERFLDLLERYFAASDGKRDARPELHYQVRAVCEDVIAIAGASCQLYTSTRMHYYRSA